MSMKERITQDLKDAMRAKDAAKRDTLRNVQAAIKQVEVDQQKQLDDAGIIKVLMSEAKKRREGIEIYESAGRTADADVERQELGIIESYLPQQLSRDEIKTLAQGVIDDVGATSMKDMGKVMSGLMAKVKGQADGRLVNEIVRELLG